MEHVGCEAVKAGIVTYLDSQQLNAGILASFALINDALTGAFMVNMIICWPSA